ncbi:MAG: type II toxin-antitoxin system VapC family toxin [Candidatus Bathyarchaeota archaeon]|nr:type II toxin-antitoxin system VapC family toxin [Candidatus Bathyarchaeota archaeon]
MRLIDADILSYALFQKHDAHPYCWPLLQDAVHGKLSAAVTAANLMEAYHALVEDYGVEREEAQYKLDGLTRSTKIRFLPLTVDTARKALEIAKLHKVRSFDATLIASAETNNISVVVSNDAHIARLCRERGLIIENPIPKEASKRMRL